MYIMKLNITCYHLMFNFPCHNVGHGDFISPYSMKPFESNIERMMLGCQALISRATLTLPSTNTTQTTGELFAQYWEELKPDNSTYLQDFK